MRGRYRNGSSAIRTARRNARRRGKLESGTRRARGLHLYRQRNRAMHHRCDRTGHRNRTATARCRDRRQHGHMRGRYRERSSAIRTARGDARYRGVMEPSTCRGRGIHLHRQRNSTLHHRRNSTGNRNRTASTASTDHQRNARGLRRGRHQHRDQL